MHVSSTQSAVSHSCRRDSQWRHCHCRIPNAVLAVQSSATHTISVNSGGLSTLSQELASSHAADKGECPACSALSWSSTSQHFHKSGQIRGTHLSLLRREAHLECDGGPQLRRRARVLRAALVQLQAVQRAHVAGHARRQAAPDVHGLPAKLLRALRGCALWLRLRLRQQRSDARDVLLHGSITQGQAV